MVGILNKDQIDHILLDNKIGRLGCSSDNKPYVLPVVYAYDGKYVYVHSREGTKIKIMRKNPNVCLEVDDIDSMSNWRCVILRGNYEELKPGAAFNRAAKLLNDRFIAYKVSESSQPSFGVPAGPERVEKKKRGIIFRIVVSEMSGRFERFD